MGEGRKLAHVADALGEGDGDGPASQQGQKPLRRLKARVVAIEGEEDAGAAPEGRGDPLNALRAESGAGWDAPSGKGEPVEQPLGHDRPIRGGAETPETQHWLGAGEGLEAGCPVGNDRSPGEPADEAACLPRTRYGVGDDDHAGEPLRSPLHEQPGVPDALLGEAEGLQGLPQPVARRVAEAKAGCGVRADAPRGQVRPRF